MATERDRWAPRESSTPLTSSEVEAPHELLSSPQSLAGLAQLLNVPVARVRDALPVGLRRFAAMVERSDPIEGSI